MPPKIKLLPDMEGALQAVYPRKDVPILHSVFRAFPGEVVTPHNHWPCDVCKEHGFTADDLEAQWPEALDDFQKRMSNEGADFQVDKTVYKTRPLPEQPAEPMVFLELDFDGGPRLGIAYPNGEKEYQEISPATRRRLLTMAEGLQDRKEGESVDKQIERTRDAIRASQSLEDLGPVANKALAFQEQLLLNALKKLEEVN